MKKLTVDDLKRFRDRLYLPIPDTELDEDDVPPYYHPGDDSDEIEYMKERRAPARRLAARAVDRSKQLKLPGDEIVRRPQAGLGQAEGGHHDGVRPAAQGPDEGQGDRPALRADHPRRGAHLRHGLALPDARRSTSRTGQPYASVDRELLLSYKESTAGPDPARGHQRGRLDGLVHRRRHLVRHARRADDPDLHLLLDVRVPADRRRASGRRPTRWPAASCSAPPPGGPR